MVERLLEESETLLLDTPYLRRMRELGRELGREEGRELGREEGREEGLREAILEAVVRRFNPPATDYRALQRRLWLHRRAARRGRRADLLLLLEQLPLVQPVANPIFIFGQFTVQGRLLYHCQVYRHAAQFNPQYLILPANDGIFCLG
jgi:hypothetical protein